MREGKERLVLVMIGLITIVLGLGAVYTSLQLRRLADRGVETTTFVPEPACSQTFFFPPVTTRQPTLTVSPPATDSAKVPLATSSAQEATASPPLAPTGE